MNTPTSPSSTPSLALLIVELLEARDHHSEVLSHPPRGIGHHGGFTDQEILASEARSRAKHAAKVARARDRLARVIEQIDTVYGSRPSLS